eukprot:g172.t1
MRPRNETRRQRGGRAVLSGGVPGRITVGAVKRRPCQDIRGPQKLVSYQIPKANSEKELAVIRAIIAREQSIAELLKHVSTYGPRMVKNAGKAMNITNACFGALDQDTTDLLLRVRVTGVMVCEAVQDWRFQLTLPRPFVWQSKNYIQGMACDVNFLHFDKTVSTILGKGRTKRNPFVTEERNINELAQFQWGGDPSSVPKSVVASGVNEQRLQAAAQMILEEEMRCGKADAKMPPPTWYIQRKKRMLAMGINLQAGADEPTENKSLKRRTKPPPRQKKKKQNTESKVEMEKEEAKSAPPPQKESIKMGRKKKRLLEVKTDTTIPLQTCPIHFPGCEQKRRYGRTQDGRVFLSRAVAWLLPPEEAKVVDAGQMLANAKQKEETDDIDSRVEIHAEIYVPNRSAHNGCCGPAAPGSNIITTLKDLIDGGFVHVDKASLGLHTNDMPWATLPPITNKRRVSKQKQKGSKQTKKRRKRGPRAAQLKRQAELKEKKARAKQENEARKSRIDAAMSFLLERLVPTVAGGLAWRKHGPLIAKSKRRNLHSIGASLSEGVDASFADTMLPGQSNNLRRKDNMGRVQHKNRFLLGRELNWYHREAIGIGRFWNQSASQQTLPVVLVPDLRVEVLVHSHLQDIVVHALSPVVLARAHLLEALARAHLLEALTRAHLLEALARARLREVLVRARLLEPLVHVLPPEVLAHARLLEVLVHVLPPEVQVVAIVIKDVSPMWWQVE